MKSSTKCTALLLLGIFVSSCSAPVYYFTPKPGTGQDLVYLQGYPNTYGVQQQDENAAVAIYLHPTAGNEMFNGMALFYVVIINKTDRDLPFGPRNIVAYNKDHEFLKLFSLSDIYSKVKANKNLEELKYILASSFLAAVETAPYSYQQTVGNFSGRDSMGRNVSGTYVETNHNTGAESAAQQRSSARIASQADDLSRRAQRVLDVLERFSIVPSTIRPTERIEGFVALELKGDAQRESEWRFRVSLDNRTYSLNFGVR
jgi:hypothetical protein